MPSAAKYDLTFWRRVLGRAACTPLMGTLKRMVENQAQKVTVALVDNLDEHDVLESMLEDSKPMSLVHKDLHKFDYLLRTPWRYPPLQWGSRFGRRFEPSLFYGSLSEAALYAEAAFYRYVFREGMVNPFKDRVISQHTVFEAQYQTEKGYDLTLRPFAKHEPALRHKSHYGPCQTLGTELRDRDVEAITYLSARTESQDLNIALFLPAALRSKKHRRARQVLCETVAENVTFRVGTELHGFERSRFLEDGRFPKPAS